jgi:hypothetical protein
MNKAVEYCAICGCVLQRTGNYASGTDGLDHAGRSHYVAERLFGRSSNGRKTVTGPVFTECPWGLERQFAVMCYECHEVMLHNPVIVPADIARFAELVRLRGLREPVKEADKEKLGKRIQLFQEVIAAGIRTVLNAESVVSERST